MKFIISETDEILVSHSGLALAGSLLQRTAIQKRSQSPSAWAIASGPRSPTATC